jgi:hypothetical protein
MNGPQARIREVESKDTPLPSSILSGALKNLDTPVVVDLRNVACPDRNLSR